MLTMIYLNFFAFLVCYYSLLSNFPITFLKALWSYLLINAYIGSY